MGYWLGIDVGSTFTAAAVCRGEGSRWSSPEVVALGGSSAVVSSVVYLGEGGQVVVGKAAQRRALTDPDRVVRDFKQRIGDQVPMVIGGQAYPAAQVAAMVIQWVIAQVEAREGGPAAGIVLTHPAGWGSYKLEVLIEALRAAGAPEVRFVTEPEAAAAGYALCQRVEPGRTIAVYDLGGGTFDAAVVRTGVAGGFSVLGRPHGLEALGGVDFDDAIFAHLLAAVPALAELDPDDPAALAATASLRRECTQAKEALSADTEVTIPVLAPGISTQVRLHRAEFEDMIRPHISDTIHALRATLRSAGLEPGEVDAILLVGGSSRIPLVTQLLSADVNRPVAIDTDPTTAIALGAAHLACPPPASVLPTGVAEDPPVAESPAPSERPEPPSLTAVPLAVEPAELQSRRARARRVKQLTLAGVMALLTAAGIASVPFLTARGDAGSPAKPGSAPAGTSAGPETGAPGDGVAGPVASPETGGEIHPPRASTRLAPAAANHRADAAKPAPTSAVSEPIRVTAEPGTSGWSNPFPTTAAPTPDPPTQTPEPTTPAPPPTTSSAPATTKESPPPTTTTTRKTTTKTAAPTTSTPSPHPRRPDT